MYVSDVYGLNKIHILKNKLQRPNVKHAPGYYFVLYSF